MVEPGRRCLDHRYELHTLIASGGMGQVWRGQDVALGRPVAVKVLRSEYTSDPTFLARFRAEAQLSASLSHPNVARVFDYGEAVAGDGSGETLAYLVMELVDGEPLSAVLRRKGRLDAETTLSLLRQTAFALGEAHRAGMVHRDVKPGNILVRPDGSVKITDFGIAWSAGSVPLTRTGQVLGTPQYLSPEQAEGRLATPASDVYALGLVGYECLTGRTAFDGDNAVTIALKQVRQDPEPLPGDLPPGVRTLITRALAKDPAARIPDGAAFVDAIDDALEGRAAEPATVAVRRPPPPPRHHRTGARGRVARLLVPLVALLVGAGVCAAVLAQVWGGSRPSPAVAAVTHDNARIVLDPTDYVGRPVDEVAVQLAALGLTVQRSPQVSTDVAPGLVITVSPAETRLKPGDRVLVTYAVAPPDTGSATAPQPDTGGHPRTHAPSTLAVAVPDPQTPATTTQTPGQSSSGTPAPTTTPTTATGSGTTTSGSATSTSTSTTTPGSGTTTSTSTSSGHTTQETSQ